MNRALQRGKSIICSESVLAILRERVRRSGRDASRHYMCPQCKKRTKLYQLEDNRRKCKECGKKFTMNGVRGQEKLHVLADALVCFCLEFPSIQAAKITGHRMRTMDLFYQEIRRGIATKDWNREHRRLAVEVESIDRGFVDSAFCKRCRKRKGCHGRVRGDAAVFGVRFKEKGILEIDPIGDESIVPPGEYCPPLIHRKRKDPYAKYAGFICHGTFHRFHDREESGHMRDGAEQFWSWAQERLARYHGIRAENLGWYMKELEWKYNRRMLSPLEQAHELAASFPLPGRRSKK